MQAAIVSTAAAPPIAGRIGAWKHQRPVACRRTGTQRQVKHCQQVYVRAAAGADNTTAANGNGNGNGAVAPVAIPTRLNTIPHERTTRQFFYQQTTAGILKAVAAGETRISARCVFPELNTEFDVYRIGTMLELVREVVTALTADGKRVKVCVQQALGKGVFMGLPLSLNGVMRIMDKMDWGEHADLITRGNMGAAEVESADAFVLISPQNIVGHSIMPILSEMADAAEGAGKPLILINPKLTDIQSAGGVGSVRGRQGRLDFIATFVTAFHFRLLYRGAAMHPIMGALRYEYGGPWEVYRRVELGPGVESYDLIGSFDKEPTPTLITDAFRAAWDRD